MKNHLAKIYIVCVITTMAIVGYSINNIYGSLNTFVKKTGKDISYFYNIFNNTATKNNFAKTENLNILVLGLDERNDWLEKTQTTDTILLANLNFKKNKINLISLPRDLWSFDQKTKINGIYQTSIQNNKGLDFVKSEYQKIFGKNIDKIVIINTSNLVDFIKIIGPVEINMDIDYKDEKYPNPEYISSHGKNVPIYKTVEFKKGKNIINENNVTEFVRSRKGSETVDGGGTDLGRINRQQLLINAITEKIKSPKFLTDPQLYINLYNYKENQIKMDINDSEIVSALRMLLPSIDKLSINRINIPITEEKTKDSIIYHPLSTKFTQQWIYLPIGDTDYSSLHQYIDKKLSE